MKENDDDDEDEPEVQRVATQDGEKFVCGLQPLESKHQCKTGWIFWKTIALSVIIITNFIGCVWFSIIKHTCFWIIGPVT